MRRRRSGAAPSRRRIVAGGLAALAAGPVALRVGPARATSPAAAAAIKAAIGDARVVEGGLVLDVPMLAETGNAVPISIAVPAGDGAAAGARVESLHIVLDRNPEPVAARFRFGPAAGRAAIATRLRFFARQNVVAIARLADGTARVARQHVEITLAACIDQEEI